MTLPDILQAGYRAEAEGRIDYAAQLYHHLTDYYSRSAEADEARKALQRLDLQPSPPPAAYRSLSQALAPENLPQPPSTPLAKAAPPVAPVARGQSAPTKHQTDAGARAAYVLPAPANGYRLGRALSVIIMVAAALMILGGVALLGFGVMSGFQRPTPLGMTPMIAAPALIAGGLAVALLAQLLLAIFRTANATTDLAAMTRAKARYDGAGD